MAFSSLPRDREHSLKQLGHRLRVQGSFDCAQDDRALALRGAEAPLFHGTAGVVFGFGRINVKSKVKGSGRGRPLYTCMPSKVDATFVDFTFVPRAWESGVGSEDCAATGAAFFIGRRRTADSSLALSALRVGASGSE
jgi:hypothetical protein